MLNIIYNIYCLDAEPCSFDERLLILSSNKCHFYLIIKLLHICA